MVYRVSKEWRVGEWLIGNSAKKYTFAGIDNRCMSEDYEKKLHLSKAHLVGFKSIRDLELELKPGLNILIGKNGSGKSNLLEFLKGVLDMLYSKPSTNFKFAEIRLSDRESIFFKYTTERKQVRLSEAKELLGESMYEQMMTVGDVVIYNDHEDESKKPTFLYDGLTYSMGRKPHMLLLRLGFGFFMPTYIQYALPERLMGITAPGSLVVSYDDTMLWDINLEGIMLYTGYMLNSVVEAEYFSLFEENNETEFKNVLDLLTTASVRESMLLDENIKDNLALYTPIKNIRINENINIVRDEKSISINNIFLEFLVNGQWLPWSHLSDGTRRMFYIISEVTAKANGLILIEEPELGIHPHQFHLVMKFLEEQAESKQIIISTHSPKTLDVLGQDELDQIMIAEYDKAKGTQIRRMTDLQKEKARGYMQDVGFLSDYWLMSDLEEWSELD